MSMESSSQGSGPAAGAALANRPPETADQRPQTRVIVTLVLIVLGGYAAFLVAGFGSSLDNLQAYNVRPLPLYVYCGALLLFLQSQVVRVVNRPGMSVLGRRISFLQTLYIFVTSAFALVYMGQALFFRGSNNITQQPATYIILNALAIIVLVVDLIYRRTPVGREDRQQRGLSELNSPFLSLAVDVAGIAAYCYLAWASLTILASLQPPYVVVDIHQLGLPGIYYLQDLNLVLALALTAVALALAVMQGLFVNTSALREKRDEMFWQQLLRVGRTAAWDGLGSLRLVLGPLIWLIPAYSIGQFAIQSTDYFRQVSTKTGQDIWELFNPFSQNSLDNFGRGLLVLALALIAVATVILASVVVEHNIDLLRSTLTMLGNAARALTLVLALFLLSLAVINAVAVIVAKVNEPFQLGAAALVAVVLAIVTPLAQRVRTSMARRR